MSIPLESLTWATNLNQRACARPLSVALCIQTVISNKQNECLRNVAAIASENLAWAHYAAYCTDRERRLRRTAFQHLNQFLASGQSWSFNERKEFVNWLCVYLVEYESDAYGLIPQPLVDQLVEPTLVEWAQAEPTDSTPCRWLGLFFSGGKYLGIPAGLMPSMQESYKYLRSALARNPDDQIARTRLIEMLIGDAEYSCHHLPEFYIGERESDSKLLAEAREHLLHISDPKVTRRLQSALDQMSQLIGDWESFTCSGQDDFNKWCIDRGHVYQWIKTFYYGPKGT